MTPTRHRSNAYLTYNEIDEWFEQHRSKSLAMEAAYLALMAELIPAQAHILDAGCGTGAPIAQYLIQQGYRVTGIDASSAMLARCQARLPDGDWQLADMRDYTSTSRFDAIIAWHSFFHLPPEDQPATLQSLTSMLAHNGVLMFTSGTSHGEIWGNNGGHDLYHGSLSSADYHERLSTLGCTVIRHVANDASAGGATVWVAQKTG